MLEQREKVGKLCKAVDIRERPSLRSAEHGPVQSCWHHTKNKQENKQEIKIASLLLVSQAHRSQIASLHASGICGYQNAQLKFQV